MTCRFCGKDISHKHKGAVYCDVDCMSKGYLSKPKEEFHNKYKIMPSGCWHWIGSIDVNGYGRIGSNHKTIKAHRLSYEVNIGKIPNGLLVCHRCDNPPCVNPNHLFLGTIKDNNDDKISKGRDNPVFGTGQPNHKINNTIARKIFSARGTHLSIANKYGVSRRLVGKIKKGELWFRANADKLQAKADA